MRIARNKVMYYLASCLGSHFCYCPSLLSFLPSSVKCSMMSDSILQCFYFLEMNENSVKNGLPTTTTNVRWGGVVVSASDFRSDGRMEDRRVGCSRFGWSLRYCVVSLDKKLCTTLSLFTQVYIKMGIGDIPLPRVAL